MNVVRILILAIFGNFGDFGNGLYPLNHSKYLFLF